MGGTKGEAQWPDFAFKLNAYTALDDPAAATEMTRLDDSSCKSKKIADMTPAMQSAARRLFFALTMLTSHGAMEIVRQGIDEKNGFEAYAALVARLSPNKKGRLLGRVHALLNPDFGTDLDTLADKLSKWAEGLREHEAQSADILPGSVKCAVSTQTMPRSGPSTSDPQRRNLRLAADARLYRNLPPVSVDVEDDADEPLWNRSERGWPQR